MNKILKNEQGVSLVEVLAVLIVGGLIMAISTSLIVQAMNNQERITIESNLRDEADIMMAQLTKAIFTLKESEIEKVECGIITEGIKELTSCTTDVADLPVDQANAVASANAKMKNCITTIDKIEELKEKRGSYCIPFALITIKGTGEKIGIEGPTVYTRTDSYTINNKNVVLEPYFTIDRKEEPYALDGKEVLNAERVSMKISFTLRHLVKDNTITFQNEILTVDDI